MNKKIVGIFLIMLVIVPTVIPAISAMNKKVKDFEKKIDDINEDESLIAPQLAFIFGRVETKYRGSIGWECTARNLRIFNFGELRYYHYSNSERIDISRFGLGLFIFRFIIGFYMIM